MIIIMILMYNPPCPCVCSDDGGGPGLECVSQRVCSLHVAPTKGLHHHLPLLFDYFHLCCVELTVHGTLIAIHQPFIRLVISLSVILVVNIIQTFYVMVLRDHGLYMYVVNI